MIQFSLLAFALVATSVDVQLTDGGRVTGELQNFTSESLLLKTETEPLAVPRAQIRKLEFGELDVTETPSVFVRLLDGSLVPCSTVATKDKDLELTHADGRQWTTATSNIRAIRWPVPGEATETQWNEILAKGEADDLLVIRREKSLDYLKGVVVGISTEQITFDFEGGTIPVPLSKAGGVIFARRNQEYPSPRLTLTTHDGGRWMLERAESRTGTTFEVKSVSGVVAEIPVSAVRRLELAQLGASFVSDLKPDYWSFDPFYDSKLLGSSLAQLYQPQMDSSFDGLPLRISDRSSPSGWREFRRGVAVHSRTELTYRLASQFRTFQATVGMDPLAASQANVRLVIFADDEPVFERAVDGEEEPVEVSVDVTGVRRMRVLVDFGSDLDVGDRLHFGDARLIK